MGLQSYLQAGTRFFHHGCERGQNARAEGLICSIVLSVQKCQPLVWFILFVAETKQMSQLLGVCLYRLYFLCQSPQENV